MQSLLNTCLYDVFSLILTKPHTNLNVGIRFKEVSHLRPIYLWNWMECPNRPLWNPQVALKRSYKHNEDLYVSWCKRWLAWWQWQCKVRVRVVHGTLPYNTLTRDSLQDHHNEMIPTFFTNSCGFRRVYDTVIIKGGMGCWEPRSAWLLEYVGSRKNTLPHSRHPTM